MYMHVHTALNECKTLKGGRYVWAHHFRGFGLWSHVEQNILGEKKQLPEVEQHCLITYRDKKIPLSN